MGAGRRGNSTGQLRIIGGEWGSRRLGFPAIAGLRPTTDRVRETLFNWLAPALRGARCADLFAGSGALGLEALSRGAAHCDFIDRSETVCQAISKHLLTLNAGDRAQVFPTTAQRFLRDTSHQFDIVFIDPPFGEGLVDVTCRQLEEEGRLATDAMVYTESGAREAGSSGIAASWQLHREKTMGGVTCRLYALATTKSQ